MTRKAVSDKLREFARGNSLTLPLKGASRRGTPNPLTDWERLFIRDHHKEISVPSFARAMCRSTTMIYSFMEEDGLRERQSMGGKRIRDEDSEIYFNNDIDRDWLVG